VRSLAFPSRFLAGVACAFWVSACVGPRRPPEPKAAPANGPVEGRALYEARCDECHALPPPGAHAPETWSLILDRMKVKARLTPREEHLVRAYVLANAAWTRPEPKAP